MIGGVEVSGGPEPWQEAVRGGYADPAVLSLSGIEQIRSWARGLVPAPPLSRLTGLHYTAFAEGSASFCMPASGWLVGPAGALTIGVLAILADPALGCAIQTVLPAALPYTTAEMSLTAVRPAYGDGKLLSAAGMVVHPGRRMALSEAVIRDAQGRLVAHSTSRCMIFPPIVGLPPADRLQRLPPHDDADDPWRRPPQGEVLPQEVWERHDGLEIQRRLADGRLPRPPLSHFTGLRLTHADAGTTRMVLPPSGWLASPSGFVEGGFIAMVADAALQSAIQTTAPAGCAVASVDLKVNFLRPVPPDGGALVATGTVVHRGNSLVVADADVVNAQGKRVAVATGSGLLLPGRPASLEGGMELTQSEEAG